MTIFAGGYPIAMSTDAKVPQPTTTDPIDVGIYKPFKKEWSCEVKTRGLSDQIKELLLKKNRIFSKSERRKFIRTVEHYGRVEFRGVHKK